MLSKPIYNKMNYQIHEGKPESKYECCILLPMILIVPILAVLLAIFKNDFHTIFTKFVKHLRAVAIHQT